MLTAALARHLAELGLVTYDDDDADCFLEDLPRGKVDAVGIYAEAGPEPRPFVGMRKPGIQIIVRTDPRSPAGRARSGWDWAQAILDALDGTSRVVWGAESPDAIRVAYCLAVQSAPFDLGPDENGAPRWSVRFRIETSGAAA